MIYGFIHPGSGLGNQLHRYIATRTLAEQKGYDFSMIGRENFKGKSFMNLDMGKLPPKEWNYLVDPSGKIIVDTHFDDTKLWEENTPYYNPEFNFIEDNTIIDGNFEDERYFEHILPEISEWLKVEPIEVPDDICVIGFRGGEFYAVPQLGLPKEYYDRAIKEMQKLGITKFEVHTDDPELAKQFFPNYKIIKDISINWRSVRFAKYAIIANSSFYVLPRLLSKGITIAPKYWNRYNTKKWEYPQGYYKEFKYI